VFEARSKPCVYGIRNGLRQAGIPLQVSTPQCQRGIPAESLPARTSATTFSDITRLAEYSQYLVLLPCELSWILAPP
jgi:hypothetical protein